MGWRSYSVWSRITTGCSRARACSGLFSGNYRWLLGTFGDTDESISYQFVLSKGPCAPLAGAAPPSVSARGAEALPAFTRAEPR